MYLEAFGGFKGILGENAFVIWGWGGVKVQDTWHPRNHILIGIHRFFGGLVTL